ncbi:MAG: isochorismatase family protein [Methylococcaceae bacterium]|nr:MAG: isochorismatase family protein [Methylococcaceae bacterium]
MSIALAAGDALIVTDVQNDFLPGGSLAVADSTAVIPVLNRYIACFRARRLPVFATRDWHPPNHCSFSPQGGPWPPHCIANTPGASFPAGLELPADVHIVSKADTPEQEAYSSFGGGRLHALLQAAGSRRLFIGGLTTDYCVLNSVKDALRLHYAVFLLVDAVRAVNAQPDDGCRALQEMTRLGAVRIRYEELSV